MQDNGSGTTLNAAQEYERKYQEDKKRQMILKAQEAFEAKQKAAQPQDEQEPDIDLNAYIPQDVEPAQEDQEDEQGMIGKSLDAVGTAFAENYYPLKFPRSFQREKKVSL